MLKFEKKIRCRKVKAESVLKEVMYFLKLLTSVHSRLVARNPSSGRRGFVSETMQGGVSEMTSDNSNNPNIQNKREAL